MESILLVDGHDLVRAGIRRLLEESGEFRVLESSSAADALRVVRRERPRVILIDVALPDMTGVEATRRLLRVDPALRIMVVSAHRRGPVPTHALEAGAIGYLTKGTPVAEMLQAVRRVAAGCRYVCAEAAQEMVLSRHQPSGHSIATLSQRELEVMVLVSRGQTLQQISEKLCLSPKTISTYRTRVLGKLRASSDVELTHLALRHGLVEPGACP